MPFRLVAPFQPSGDQPRAIEALSRGLTAGLRFQTLLGVTGSGKTFTMANVIVHEQKPTLILSHNKTLAAQLYEELRRFFPDNAVRYFVSYYDYYQPEAYIPQTDTYIEKDASINAELDQLRHAATQAVLSRKDVIVVASVSAIYNIGSPENYNSLSMRLSRGQRLTRRALLEHLSDLHYDRNDVDPLPGTYRVRSDDIRVVPPTGERAVHILLEKNAIRELMEGGIGHKDPQNNIASVKIFPAKFWLAPKETMPLALTNVEAELADRLREFKSHHKLLEAQRLERRVREDIAMMRETGFCHGIENYSRHLEFREPGSMPFTLLDYFNQAYGQNGWLTIADESHQTVPQLKGMVHGDRSRKDMLIEYGFRLPSARDNRPLAFEETMQKLGPIIFTTATPGPFEVDVSEKVVNEKSPTSAPQRSSTTQHPKIERGFVEQLIRPTGLLDPSIEIRPLRGQLDYLVQEIRKRVEKKQRTLVTTLTKRLAEELTEWLEQQGIKVEYLHADIKTLERPEILHRMRSGEIDVVVGINLLREGLDLPEVSLVAILDADQEGFLRNETTLVQTMGRAARHLEGHVILFADRVTRSMSAAIQETHRRREIQEKWNRKYAITPQSIAKPVERSSLFTQQTEDEPPPGPLTPKALKELEKEMRDAVKRLEFERAAKIRDLIQRMQNES